MKIGCLATKLGKWKKIENNTHRRECLCKSQCRNLRRCSSDRFLLMDSIALANSVRRMDSRGLFSWVCQDRDHVRCLRLFLLFVCLLVWIYVRKMSCEVCIYEIKGSKLLGLSQLCNSYNQNLSCETCSEYMIKALPIGSKITAYSDKISQTFIRFKIIMGFPYLLARFSKCSLVAS